MPDRESFLDLADSPDPMTGASPNAAHNALAQYLQWRSQGLEDLHKMTSREKGQVLMSGFNPGHLGAAAGIMAGKQGAMSAAFKGFSRPLGNLDMAEELTAKGVDPEAIRKNLGWYQNEDGRWRFELDDSKSKLIPQDIETGKPVPLASALDHPTLYTAYPELKDYSLTFAERGQLSNDTLGKHIPGQGILLNPNVAESSTTTKSVLLHEVQHAVQHIEGFARGGTPEQFVAPPHSEQSPYRDQFEKSIYNVIDRMGISKDPNSYTDAQIKLIHQAAQHDMYQRMLGEAEARGVQSRMDWTPEQRQAISPLAIQGDVHLHPVEHNPFAAPEGGMSLTPIEHDPFEATP